MLWIKLGDGRGFEVQNRLIAAVSEKRIGLRSMEERMSLLGSEMKIESSPGKGTRVFIEIPYRERKRGSKEKHFDH